MIQSRDVTHLLLFLCEYMHRHLVIDERMNFTRIVNFCLDGSRCGIGYGNDFQRIFRPQRFGGFGQFNALDIASMSNCLPTSLPLSSPSLPPPPPSHSLTYSLSLAALDYSVSQHSISTLHTDTNRTYSYTAHF